MNNTLIRKFLFVAASVAAGWIAAFAMPPVSFWPCMFIGLSGLYWLYSKTQTMLQAFAAGFFFALGYFVTGLWWIGNALLVEGNEFAWVWPISVIGLPTILGFFTATYLAVARYVSDPKTFNGFLIFSFFLMFSEWARGHAFTGFPWNLYGYVWNDHLPMAQMAFVTGAYGMTLISVLWAATAGFLIVSIFSRKNKIFMTGITIASMAMVFIMGQYRLDHSQTEFNKDAGVVVVQPNIPQNMKWNPVEAQNNFLKTISLSRSGKFAEPIPRDIFVVWPETAISPSIYSSSENMDRMQGVLRGYSGSNAYLITGVLRRTDEGDDPAYANSVSLLDRDMSIVGIYDKFHLVPFGEFIPLQNWIPLKPVAAFKGFQRGTGAATIRHKNIPAFSPLICYEVIFPNEVVDTKEERPKWIVNVTNDGWYGDSAGPYQHFAQTRLRAIEEGLPVVRSANTGISGIIDPYGRIVESARIGEEAILVNYLPKRIENIYAIFHPWIQYLFPILAIFIIFRRVFDQKR